MILLFIILYFLVLAVGFNLGVKYTQQYLMSLKAFDQKEYEKEIDAKLKYASVKKPKK